MKVSLCAAASALVLSAAAAITGAGPAVASGGAPIVTIDTGAVRGTTVPGGYAFRGLPYAAPPTGQLRWEPPQPPASWTDLRDATNFGPSCPQVRSLFAPPPPFDEDCLFVNVSTPTLRTDAGRPVLVWIHGGGLTQDGARNYDGTKLATDGTVVVTVGYRLGALGFLAHPALADSPGGPTGNYGLMDQRAALQWVQRNISRFGGDPRNVTIAGESAGGLSVLAHLVSAGSRGLFHRAIVQSGAFALNQRPLATAEAAGEAFAARAGCPNQKLQCLRHLPVAALVDNFGVEIPGVIDGSVLTESIGSALAGGRFAHVPVLNGTNHDEEAIFVAIGVPVARGTFVPLPEPVTPESYQRDIAAVLGVSADRAAAIAAEYPIDPSNPNSSFSTLVSDASFVCPAGQVDSWTSTAMPTFAYEFNDDTAPQLFTGGFLPPVATHASEIPYVLDEPNVPFPTPLTADQESLATAMRAAWANFAATGDPSTSDVRWPAFDTASSGKVLSLVTPEPQVQAGFSPRHHCSFWAAG